MAMAAAYMQLAAEHGSGAAQYRLGLVQAVGLGVDANVTEGYKWLSLAAAAGGEEKDALLATALRDKLAARMTPAEVEAALVSHEAVLEAADVESLDELPDQAQAERRLERLVNEREGMGPVNLPQTAAGKLFAGIYALYAGLVFIVTAALLFTPVLHRMLHRFHWDEKL